MQADNATVDQLPGLVRSFVQYLTRYVEEGNVTEIHSIYENSFNKLTERFFKSSSWPSVAVVAPLLGKKELPRMLYKELYFRHIYSRLSPTLADRMESWNNYLDLFSLLNEQNTNIKLPHSWLFDLIDEFVWQAQSFNHYRAKLKNLSASDKATLAKNPEAWNVVSVLRNLEKIAELSKINEELVSGKWNSVSEGEGKDYAALGYFVLVGQLRMHCMMGDYHTALRFIDNIQMMSGNDEDLFCSSVTACHITLYYYTGFCYMMLLRYADASNCFASILLFLSRTKQIHTRSYQWELIVKKQDQILALLAMSLCLSSPRHLDGSLEEMLREKHAEHLARLRKGDSAAFEELFAQACPKFVSLSSPSLDQNVNLHLEPLRFQQSAFLAEVKQQSLIPVIRSYLKLYSSIDTQKLASFLKVSVEELRALLLSYKHKSRSFEWSGKEPLNGKWNDQVTGDTNFFVDQEMVHVTDIEHNQNFIAPLLDGISKIDDVLNAR